MTTISDPRVLTIEQQLEPQLLDRAASRSRLAVAVGVGLTLFAVLNATAAVYLYRGITDLRVVEAHLEQLGSFEQRIGARLDSVNNGFQSRFEKLDSQLQGRFNEINGNIAKVEQNLPQAGDAGLSRAPEPVFTTSTVAEASSDTEVAAEPDAVDAPRPPKRRIAASPPPPNPGYQRTETPEGKVYYRKIN